MKKTVLTLAAVLLASGTAFASERFGDAAPAVNHEAQGIIATVAPAVTALSGDAAPASVVVNAPSINDFASSAAIGATGNQIGASPRILYGSN
ncbi:hypothetical protein C7441_102114 [Pseudaminobacter salicylatoxidans]|uniref:Uncharacterized protein n=1 Tax=Pseudaminobacter salicylatoxidans TaxID=93369 RepID=A0A316C7H6_PSESE|nr:hypothetical protein [Pseudaminobacter salicylatoxidans]PWJ85670.1 hypothetical protein C7441_102114 [Pseudaminobacter salicylatoxidans]